MRRRIITILLAVAGLLVLAGEWISGLDLLARLPKVGAATMNWLTEVDYFLLNNDLHPFVLAIVFVVLWTGIIVPDAWPFVRRWLFGRVRKEFRAEFDAPINQDARDDFSALLARAYTNYGSSPKPQLREKIDGIVFPDDFLPLVGALSNCAYGIAWPNNVSEDWWNFVTALTADVYSGHDGGLLSAADAEVFRRARRMTAKFWNKWAMELMAGTIRYGDLQREIFENHRAIIALATTELAHAHIVTFGLGPGKTGLFELAIRPAKLGPDSWWKGFTRRVKNKIFSGKHISLEEARKAK